MRHWPELGRPVKIWGAGLDLWQECRIGEPRGSGLTSKGLQVVWRSGGNSWGVGKDLGDVL